MDGALVYVAMGAAAAGLVQGISGFAFGLVAMSFWVWSVPPLLAGPMVVFGSLIGQLLASGTLRRGFHLGRILPFVIGGVVGVPIGVWFLPHVDPDLFKAGVGLLLLIYCPALLLARDLPRLQRGGRMADGGVGFLGGILGGIGGLSGPAPTLWSTLRGWDKDGQRAVLQTFNLCMHFLTFGMYIATGVVTANMIGMFGIVAVAAFLPTLVGIWLYGRLDQILFRKLILALLTVSGIVLLVTSLGRLL